MSPARIAAIVAGGLVMAVWAPVLVAGLATLRHREPLGRSDTLIVTGVYRYVRHPLYAGLCFTLAGLGGVLGRWTLVAGGLGWLVVTQLWSIHEERDLAERFGAEYEEWRASTPRLVPDVRRFARDVMGGRERRGG